MGPAHESLGMDDKRTGVVPGLNDPDRRRIGKSGVKNLASSSPAACVKIQSTFQWNPCNLCALIISSIYQDEWG